MERFLDTKLMHPREQVVKVIDRIYRRGMTTASGENISINRAALWRVLPCFFYFVAGLFR
jgi:hypothetical protein